jgi:hypothetical protein
MIPRHNLRHDVTVAWVVALRAQWFWQAKGLSVAVASSNFEI